ncbi:sensor histidine kinase [Hominenteromicrobium sp.]|uniref:sensor histidine kinase n=1 Tax=Hominenteromicrobium sp. TaxID=3073581 RepID=UPI003AB8B274
MWVKKQKKSVSIRGILFTIIILIFLSTMASVLLLVNYFETLNEYRNNLYNINLSAYTSVLKENFNSLSMTMNVSALDPSIRENIFREDVSDSEMLAIGNGMRKIIESNAYLITPKSEIYTHKFFSKLPGDGKNFFYITEMEKESWYQDYVESGALEYHCYSYSYLAQSYQLTLVHAINNFSINAPVYGESNERCYEALTVNLGGIMPKKNDTLTDVPAEAFLVQDKNMEVVYTTKSRLNSTAVKAMEAMLQGGRLENREYKATYRQDNVRYTAACVKIPVMKATLVVLFEPLPIGRAEIKSEMGVLLFIVAVFVVLTIVLLFFYRSHRKRIRGLVRLLDDFDETSAVSAEIVQGGDELDDVDRHIVLMQNRIRTLIEEEYTVKLQMISAQHEALIACINPHFLYNTLNSISAMASIEDAQDTNRMIYSLSNMFRYSADVSKKMVLLRDELQNIKDYLDIQAVRFGESFTYHIDVDARFYECEVPKLILQPVVENCFKHGFSAEKSPGSSGQSEIIICAVQNEDKLEIYVMDNGRGMDVVRLQAVQEKLKNGAQTQRDASGTEIGLSNVHRRLQMVYGASCGLSVLGEENKFTCVKITLILR